MNASHLISSKEAFSAIVERTAKVCDKYIDRDPAIAEAVAKFQRVYAERIESLNPTIMIYGIYNAGKSTLINALVGDKIAEMNDVPTTVKVTPYKWNEYTIYDTPGINAPKKDEEVSKAQLEKTDIIVFLMDTEGQFNAAKNYREIVGVVNDKKRLLIVLNNKSGIDMQTSEGLQRLEVIKGEIYNDFAEAYGSNFSAQELASLFKIVVVDAQMALQARTDNSLSEEDRALLVDSSNITALEDAIKVEYAKASGFTVLDQLAHLLSEEFEAVAKLLKGLSVDNTSKAGIDTQDKLSKQQDDLKAKISDYVYDHMPELRDSIISILNRAKDEDEVKAEMEKVVGEFGARVNEYFKREVEKVSARVDSDVNDFVRLLPADVSSVANQESAAVATNIDAPEALIPSGSKRDALLETAATYAVAKPMLKAGIAAAAPLIAKVPFLGPIIAPTLPVLVPILVAVAAVKILFGGEDKAALKAQMEQQQQRMNAQLAQQEAIARRRQECLEEASRAARKVCSGLIDLYNERLEQIFAPLYEEISHRLQIANAETASVVADLRLIEKAQNDLSNVVKAFVA